MDKYGEIYCITSPSGKKYVGQCLKYLSNGRKHGYIGRWKEHIRDSTYKDCCRILNASIRKYGPENFTLEILKECPEDELNFYEKYYITNLNTLNPNGYNLTEGGNGGVQSYEVKEKISNSLKEYYKKNGHHNFESLTKENRINRAKKAWDTKKKNGFKARSGYKISTDTCKKMSESKNKKNALPWINVKTKEEQNLSCTEMSRYTGLSVSTFHHIKMGRSTCTKTGWKINLQ